MLESLFNWVWAALNGPAGLGISFIWGVLSVIFSPCHLATIILLIGFISRRGNHDKKKTFVISLLFCAGIVIDMLVFGALAGAAGMLFSKTGIILKIGVGVIFALIGIYLLELIPGIGNDRSHLAKVATNSWWSVVVLGLISGVVLAPCTLGFMAPILTASAGMMQQSFVKGIAFTGVYVLGHIGVIVLAGVFSGIFVRYLDHMEKSMIAGIIKKGMAFLLIGAGIYIALS